ncbi:MAG TPA: membrane protein insertion efficiency factor YidD [Bacillota bacterium]|jgi:putative membrane protein insertion efficiency factor|nr:membrane protein insertion efficiency factor YidD [Bacillota bacterium]HOA34640.1 membrane protein insertion efficiency factor YidD [Bacillota bacterium]HOJ83278.1 membrane protein insertion efficiency factor YidD [Bacillota bacterium]HOL15387.1 membrane protein insertion efficiency factor YidD [Bacillota bacterium]HPZ11349.1 membrane protein insertion efficiency factor YidD [Bacillota bacterium]
MSKAKIIDKIKRLRPAERVCLIVIRIYQKYLSPLKPASCRFYPSCSQYYYEAVLKYGFVRGSMLGIRRLLKCHPFHPGGYDPVR